MQKYGPWGCHMQILLVGVGGQVYLFLGGHRKVAFLGNSDPV